MDPTAGDPGLLAGRYRIGPMLGRGGMAEVYDAFDERLARPVAVKILRAATAVDPGMRQRFEREARSVARLSHPAVVAVYDSGEDRGRAFLVMERLPGETLADRMRAGPVDPAWLAPIAADVLGALEAAHALGLVHRDIKPANILLTGDGRAKVADFGIAKAYRDDLDIDDATGGDLTATGLILGTVAYLSPEQIDGAAASPQADIYAVGVVLYEALAGHKPYRGDNPIAQARAATEGRAEDLADIRPDLDPGLVAVIRRAMARRTVDRYPSAAAMLADLVATGLVGGTAPPPRPGPTVVMPVADATRILPVAPTRAGPAAPTRAMPVPPPGDGGGQPPRPAVPTGTGRDDHRRNRLVAAVVVLAVVVVAAAVVAVLVDRSDSSSTITPSTTTPTTPGVTSPVTVAPTTAGASTTTPTTAAPSTTTSTTVPPTTSTSARTTTTTAPTTTTTSAGSTTTGG